MVGIYLTTRELCQRSGIRRTNIFYLRQRFGATNLQPAARVGRSDLWLESDVQKVRGLVAAYLPTRGRPRKSQAMALTEGRKA